MRLEVHQYRIVDGRAKFIRDLSEAEEQASSSIDSDADLFGDTSSDGPSRREHFSVNWDDDYGTALGKIALMSGIPRDLLLLTRHDLVAIGFHYQYVMKSTDFAPCLRDHLVTGDTKASAHTGRFRTTPLTGVVYDNKFISNNQKGKIRVNIRVGEILAVFLQSEGKPCDPTEIPRLDTRLYVWNLRDIIMDLRGQYDEPMYEGFVSLFWPMISQSTFRSMLSGSRSTQAMGSSEDDSFRSRVIMEQNYVDYLDSVDLATDRSPMTKGGFAVRSSLNNVTLKVKNSIDRNVTVWHLRRIFDLLPLSDMFPCMAFFDGSQRTTLLRTRKTFINDHFDKYNKIRDKRVGTAFYGLRVWHLYNDGFGWIYLMPNGEMTIRTSWSYSIVNDLTNIHHMNRLVNIFREQILAIEHSRMFNLPRPIIIQQTESELVPHLEYFNVQLFVEHPEGATPLDNARFRMLLLSLPIHLDLKPSEENHLVFVGDYTRAGMFRKTPKENPTGVKFRLNNNGSIRLGELRSSRQLCAIVDFVKRVAALSTSGPGAGKQEFERHPLIAQNIRKAENKFPWLADRAESRDAWDGTYKDMRVRILQKADPQLFNYHKYITARQKIEFTPYSKLCQGEQQPMVYSSMADVKKFASTRKHFTHHLEYQNKTDQTNGRPPRTMFYVCPHRKYPYPGFKDSKLHPKGFCLPCCKKTSSIENKNSANYAKYVACLTNTEKELEDNFLNPWYVRNYGKRLRPEQLSRLPEDLFYLFNRGASCNIGSRKIVTPGSDCYLLMGVEALPEGPTIKYITLDNPAESRLVLRMIPIEDDAQYVIVLHNNTGNNVVVHIGPDKSRTTVHASNSKPIRRLRKVMAQIVQANERRLAEQLRAGHRIEPTLFNAEFVLRKRDPKREIYQDIRSTNSNNSNNPGSGQECIGIYNSKTYIPVIPDKPVSHIPTVPLQEVDWVRLVDGISTPEFEFRAEILYTDPAGRYFRTLLSSGPRRLLVEFSPVQRVPGLAEGYRVLRDLVPARIPPSGRSMKKDSAKTRVKEPSEVIPPQYKTPGIEKVQHRLEMYRDLVERFARELNMERRSKWREQFGKFLQQYLTDKRAGRTYPGEDGDILTPGQMFKDRVKELSQDSPAPGDDYWSMKWILSQIARRVKPGSNTSGNIDSRDLEKWLRKLTDGMVLEMDKKSKYELLGYIKDTASRTQVQDVRQIVLRLVGNKSPNDQPPQVVSKLVFDLIHNDLRRQEILNNVLPHINEMVVGDQDILELIPLASPTSVLDEAAAKKAAE